ncbi:integrase [Pseudomonas lini]|nr:integrase [Pseudomonas lini]
MKYYKPSGKEGIIVFGDYPVVTLASARKKREEARALLAEGLDPIEQKQKAKTVAQREGLRFEEVALAWHAEMSRKWAPGHSTTVMSRLKTHVFPFLGRRPIADIDTHDLLEPIERIKERGTLDVALRVQNYLSSIMRQAKRARQIGANPALDLAGTVKMPKTVHRPALPLNRLPELLGRIETYHGRDLTRLTVLFSLHVFVRSSELRFARWSEFDLKRGVWEIPDTRPALEGVPFSTRGTKMAGDIHLVPLSPQALVLLEQIRELTGRFELVFPGDTKYWKPMSENTVNKALRTMGYDTKTELCGHGFRAMACSALIESGLWSETAIERQMSHKERNNVRAAYIHKAEFIEERRLIMAWWSRYIDANQYQHLTPHEFANHVGKNVVRIKQKHGVDV